MVSFVIKGSMGLMRVQWRCTEQRAADLWNLGGENDSELNITRIKELGGNEKMQEAMKSNLECLTSFITRIKSKFPRLLQSSQL